jgi:hypothetical protein
MSLIVSSRVFAPLLNDVYNKSKLFNIENAYIPTSEQYNHKKYLFNTRIAFEEWLRPINLSQFNFFTLEDGITGGLHNWLLTEHRPIQMFESDYRWIRSLKKEVSLIRSLVDIDSEKVLYLTNPSSVDGNYLECWNAIQDLGCPIILDCAYMGTAQLKEITLKNNVEKVFFSFSKSFALPRHRAGISFSRSLKDEFNQLHNNGYFNFFTLELINIFTKEFKFDHMYNSLHRLQSEICTNLKIHPSDSVLFGQLFTQTHDKFFTQRSRYNLIKEYSEQPGHDLFWLP